DTAEFGTPEINLGLFPFMIMALIYRNVPRKRANQMLLLGERMSAEEAREAGIVNRVVPAAELDAAVDEWAQKLASKSPVVIRLGGGEEKIAKQHSQEKLTARERLDLLIDEGTFVELGMHGRPHFSQRAMEGREAPADGVVTGYGRVDGRLVAVAAYDFTVMAGSMGMTGELKVSRLRELALQKRMPLVWLLDSAGARIQEAIGSLFAGSGHLFREEVV